MVEASMGAAPSQPPIDVKTFIAQLPELLRQFGDSSAGISRLTLIDYPERPVSEVRLKESPLARDARLSGKIRQLLELSGNMLPYPEAVVLAAAGSDRLAEAFRETLVHMCEDRRPVHLWANSSIDQAVAEHVRQAIAGRALGMCSLCTLEDGTQRHLPMMDFRCSSAADLRQRNLHLIVNLLRQIGERAGVVLNSGASFHYYGLRLLSESEWKRFLGKCLLLAPLTDARYIGHRLIEGFGVLRIAPSYWKVTSPYLVWVL
jgi:hypothetical protein